MPSDKGGTKSLREIKFKEKTASETSIIAETPSQDVTIEMKIYCGRYKEYNEVGMHHWKVRNLLMRRKMVKQVKSSGADRTGPLIQEQNNHQEGCFWMIERDTEPYGGSVGKVTIFVREKRWLTRVGILNDNDNENGDTTLNESQPARGSRKKAPIIDKVDLTASPPKPVVIDLDTPPTEDDVDLSEDS